VISRYALHLPVAGTRTRVRHLLPADAAAFMSYRGDPEVGKYQGWLPMDAAASGEFIDRMARMNVLVGGRWMQVAIADAATDALLGDIGMHPDDEFSSIELGFTIAAQHQGKGFAADAVGALVTELFRQTRVQSIRGVTDARNLASIALLERLGFDRIGEQRTVFRDEPCVEYVYVRSR
jgi:[ribosomal protein S5]-alanine N-acetyltransferase